MQYAKNTWKLRKLQRRSKNLDRDVGRSESPRGRGAHSNIWSFDGLGFASDNA